MTEQKPLWPDTPLMEGAEISLVYLTDIPPNDELIGPEPTPALVSHIQRYGMLQPVILVDNSPGNGQYTVLDGRRRIKAARILGKEEILAHVLEDASEWSPSITVAANANRSRNLATELAAVQTLTSEGREPSEIATMTGLPVQTVQADLRLIGRLLPELVADIQRNQLSASVAMELAGLPTDVQQQAAKYIAQSDTPLTVKNVRDLKRVQRQEVTAGMDFLNEPMPVPKEGLDLVLHHLSEARDAADPFPNIARSIEIMMGAVEDQRGK